QQYCRAAGARRLLHPLLRRRAGGGRAGRVGLDADRRRYSVVDRLKRRGAGRAAMGRLPPAARQLPRRHARRYRGSVRSPAPGSSPRGLAGMRVRHFSVLVFSAFALVASAGVTLARTNFDGLWSVLVITEQGTCDRGYRYALRVVNGVVRCEGEAAVRVT